jgi:hypothetical protein
MTEKIDKGKHYRLSFRGVKFDPARAGRIYGITDPMLFQAFKKIAFAGKRGHKSRVSDIEDAICALNRFLEMEEEDESETELLKIIESKKIETALFTFDDLTTGNQ